MRSNFIIVLPLTILPLAGFVFGFSAAINTNGASNYLDQMQRALDVADQWHKNAYDFCVIAQRHDPALDCERFK